ncbi:MAG TPA: VOC family protein [Gemmatimonadaceae bacterium]|jgi:methylmalonyl-CoA/ethylmalonyl-CoA epimerase|nr:VOC family protein [Gemmatimonadaceae bacterium]
MPNLSQSRIGQIAVTCKDVARASAFYRDVLGLRHLFDAGPKLSFYDCAGVRLMLTTAEAPEHDHPGSILYYFVSDIDAVYRELAAKGVKFVDAPHVIAQLPDHDLWLTAFDDTEGNMLGIMEERKRPA